LFPGPGSPLLSAAPAAVGIAALVFFLAVPRLADLGAARRAPGRLQTLLAAGARSVRDTRTLLLGRNWRLVGAFAYLWGGIGALVACFAATGHNPPLAAIVLAFQIGYIANAIPVPGGIGVLDGSIVGMLVLYGIAPTPATAAVLVYHALALWIPAVWGTVAFVMLRREQGEPLHLRPTLAGRRAARRERSNSK
jgi:uncharacterized membrane protein YbhN (UPF0104 family)